MANVKLSEKGSRMLKTIKIELEIPVDKRATALRIAFSKGVDSDLEIPLDRGNGTGTEFPTSVISRENPTLIKHLIINRLGHSIENYKLHFIILSIIEIGIEVMYKEIQNLTTADSYILHLLDKHTKT